MTSADMCPQSPLGGSIGGLSDKEHLQAFAFGSLVMALINFSGLLLPEERTHLRSNVSGASPPGCRRCSGLGVLRNQPDSLLNSPLRDLSAAQ